MNKSKIFISHQHNDDALADKVVAAFEKEGCGCFVDHNKIKFGDWDQRIETELNDCTYFIVILTQNLISSDGCYVEYGRAKRQNKTIIIFKFGEINSIPYKWETHFGSIQKTTVNEKNLDSIIKEIVAYYKINDIGFSHDLNNIMKEGNKKDKEENTSDDVNFSITKNDIKKILPELIKEIGSDGKDVYTIDQKQEPHFYTKRMDKYLQNENNAKSAWGDDILYRYEFKVFADKIGMRLTPSSTGASNAVLNKMKDLHMIKCVKGEGVNDNLKNDFKYGCVFYKKFDYNENINDNEKKVLLKNCVLYALDMERQIFDEIAEKAVVETKKETYSAEEDICIKYWEKLSEILRNRSDCKLQPKDIKIHYKNYTVKGNLFKGIEVQARITKKRIQAFIWINKDNDKSINQKIYDILVTQKESFETDLSKYKNVIPDHDWKRNKDGDCVSCSIEINMENVDFTNENDWQRQHEFLADAMIALDNKLIRANEEALKNLLMK